MIHDINWEAATARFLDEPEMVECLRESVEILKEGVFDTDFLDEVKAKAKAEFDDRLETAKGEQKARLLEARTQIMENLAVTGAMALISDTFILPSTNLWEAEKS